MFRLDVTPGHESLRVVIRNLGPGRLACSQDGYAHPIGVQGDPEAVAGLRPGHHQVGFTLGEGEDRVTVSAIIATLRPPETGLVRITTQAVVRRGG